MHASTAVLGWLGRSRSFFGAVLCVALSGCTLSRPDYVTPEVAVGSPAFVRAIEAHTLSAPVDGNRADVLLNGDAIFPAMLTAVRRARKTITFANYIYEDGEIARAIAAALAERCRAGVKVDILLDAVGSGRMADPHRTMIEGPVVRTLQAAFAETWREATGVLLGGDDYFPSLPRRGNLAIQAVPSSPAGGATEAYMLFLLAIDAARSSIALTNPYFVPDDGIARALARAARRGVDVSIITAGVAGSNLDRLLRVASRAHYPRALEAGVKIYEYQAAYLHAKTVVIDRHWVSIGSVNIDNRSFALNSELNIAASDRGLAARMLEIFEHDLAHAWRVPPGDWRDAALGRLLYMSLLPLRDQL